MNDIDRRALLGAAGFAGITAIAAGGKAAGGPLNPPAGTVGGTGRTLDEVYNKIAPIGGSDGRIPIAGGSTPYVIAQAGSYVLTGPITLGAAGGNALTINVPLGADVTLDLNGYSITSSTESGFGIVGAGALPGAVTIRNGTLNGHVRGIFTGAATILIEDLVINRPRWNGISLTGSNGNSHAVIRRCFIARAGDSTVANESTDVRAIEFINYSGVIEDCVINAVTQANPARAAVGIYQNGGTSIVIRRNAVNAAGLGIRTSASNTIVYRDNTVTATATPYLTTGAVNGGGNI